MTLHNRYSEKLDSALHPGKRAGILLVLGHGVTGNMDRPLTVGLATRLAALGWPTLRFSFSGNGSSDGKFEESTITKETEDLSSVLDQVMGDQKIVYIGHSMGGAVGAIFNAKEDRLSALVSLAGMVNTRRFCDAEFGELTPGDGFMWDEPLCPLSQAYVDDLNLIHTTIDAARDSRTPWLLIHGDADDVIPPSDSDELSQVLKGPRKHVVIPDANHVFEGHYDFLADTIHQWLLELKLG